MGRARALRDQWVVGRVAWHVSCCQCRLFVLQVLHHCSNSPHPFDHWQKQCREILSPEAQSSCGKSSKAFHDEFKDPMSSMADLQALSR
jgi:hypothetical protein